MHHLKIYNKEYKLHATYYDSFKNKDDVLIYFHGGGLIFGQRNDLPREYVDVITQYFNLITVDYRLLPESSFEDILIDLKRIYNYVIDRFQHIYCMGRSAGGYLSLIFANQYKTNGVINFYGYYDTDHPLFEKIPKNHLNVTSMLTNDLVTQLKKDRVTTAEPANPRYLLYLYYRHSGLWTSLINFSISNDDLKKLPRMFIAHSINDPDVPYIYSENLNKLNKNSKLRTIDGNIHDFDNTVTHDTINLYHEACEYIKNP
ncbi:alpha/beta hydrolase [Macrococcus animalis]|uniref:alpha/beta hydrolase n=1 Tax=Macrococcus animalis TaxID=3395467 RepID=UPI0039BDAE2C